ncbi:hypothetical protein MNBD_GAMMA22-1191 [hydrothermal vent metagenome]|uniref:DUF11 domain-containing protein n=1 Tax=hydrothermal vent metagenome TaxID=652676 RepID=A0A3B1AFB2_9ZZZZ
MRVSILTKNNSKMKTLIFSFLLSLVLILPTPKAFAIATITIINADSAGEGLNDSTAFTAVVGNRASTLGQARLNAVQHAANLMGSIITSAIDIKVNVEFNSLGGGASSAPLAGAAAAFVDRNFTNAPVTNTWYPIALAEKISGANIATTGGTQEINMIVNVDVDGVFVLGTRKWYYGFDSNPPGTDIDFVTVALHELIHGLGFSSFVDLLTGVKLTSGGIGYDDSFMRLLEHHGATPADYPSMTNTQRIAASVSDTLLHWTGANVSANLAAVTAGKTGTHIHMYAPTTAESGSSVSHFNTTVTPNEMMEPNYTIANHNIGLAVYLLTDIGWGTTNVNRTAIDLQVTQTDSGATINTGANETYNLVVTNNSASTATEVVITNMIPTGSTYISATPGAGSCYQSNNIVTCQLGDMVSSGTINIAIVVTLVAAGTNTNTVFVDSVNPDSAIANNESFENSTVVANDVDLGVSQTNSVAAIDFGSNETYVITVTNNSATDGASSLVLASTLPTGATYVSATGTGWSCSISTPIVTCNLASLALASTSVVTIVATLNISGSNTNTVTINAANNDPVSGNDSSSVITTVNAQTSVATAGSSGCFIATAAYGSPMEDEVRYLRAFRDQYLLKNSAGRWFVQMYYRYSPALATRIKNNDNLRSMVRGLLSPFIKMSRQTVSKNYLDMQK